MTTVDPGVRAPGRPRSARADEAIIDAVLGLLAEGTSVESLSIEAVAARAGVGKATIYRRWPGKEALVADAVRGLKGPLPELAGGSVRGLKGPLPELAGGSVREDLLALLRHRPRTWDERSVRVMSCLVPRVRHSAETYRIYQSLVEPRRELMRQVLRRGIETGELRADLDLEVAVTILAAPHLVQRMLRWHPGLAEDETFDERVVDTVLAGFAAG